MKETLVACQNCKFVKEDRTVSRAKCKAWECRNEKSEYYRCLLNTTLEGELLKVITHTGCEEGRAGEREELELTASARLAERMKERRKELGLTQNEAAKKIGIGALALCSWETEKRPVPEKKLEDIAEAYGITVEYLKGRKLKK